MRGRVIWFYCFYSYIYCETANISADTVLPLMYAAKKYFLSGLASECRVALERSLSVDTVCTLLQHSISFNEHELKKKTLKFISKNTCQVLNTPAFLDLPHDAVNDVVGLDIIAGTSERQLYEACVKWAKHQLKRMILRMKRLEPQLAIHSIKYVPQP